MPDLPNASISPAAGPVRATNPASADGLLLADLSRHLDADLPSGAVGTETVLWRRCSLASVDIARVQQALSAAVAPDPRQDPSSDLTDVQAALLDVAVTALSTVEHLSGNGGLSMSLLLEKVQFVTDRAGLTVDAETSMGEQVARISAWIDGSSGYLGVPREAVLWRRCMKVVSEAGEVYDALGGLVGENPRKGVTGTLDDLTGEVLDVALAALGAVEHLTGNTGRSVPLLTLAIHGRWSRLRHAA